MLRNILLLTLLFVLFFLLLFKGKNTINKEKFQSRSPKLEVIDHLPNNRNSIAITIDLCPSSKKYDKELFSCFDKLGKKMGRPLHVGIAISGKWILKHQKELSEIKKLYLDVTWINHSYSHPIDKGFLNDSNVNFTSEVSDNIKLFEKFNLKPSKYFRFPGLIHNQQRLYELSNLGYIALDANAWLGKGEKIKNGSIILIHGNGNESKKIVNDFMNYLAAHEKEILSGDLQIVNLKNIDMLK